MGTLVADEAVRWAGTSANRPAHVSTTQGGQMKLSKRTAAQGLIIGALGMIVLGLGAGVASAAPTQGPPTNPGGYYGAAYQDILMDSDLINNQSAYDPNGNFVLANMFGTVCNNPGFICM